MEAESLGIVSADSLAYDESLTAVFRQTLPVMGGVRVFRSTKYNLVVVALEGAMQFYEQDGIVALVDYAVLTFNKRLKGVGRSVANPKNGCYILDIHAEGSVGDTPIQDKATVILTHNHSHGQSQLVIGRIDEAKLFTDWVDKIGHRRVTDGQNRTIGLPANLQQEKKR